MANKRFPTLVYCDTRRDVDYTEYVEFCNMLNRVPAVRDSLAYEEFVARMQSEELEDFFENAKHIMVYDAVAVESSIGTWQGAVDNPPRVFPNLYSACKWCSSSGDDVKIVLNDGKVKVATFHHDGTNHFVIRPLSSKGLNVATDKDGWVPQGLKDYHLKKFHGYLY